MDTHLYEQPDHDEGSGETVSVRPVFLVVLCHGVESDSRQLAPLASAWRALFPDAAFLVPDAPEPCKRRFWRSHGRQWFSLRLPQEMQMAGAADAAGWLNRQVEAELARLGLGAGDVVYCGFSQGAMVAMLAGLMRNVAPRGIVSVAGALMAPEGGFVARCRPPVLLIHGAADRIVPARKSESAAMRLQAAKIDVRLRLLPMLGHLILPEAAPLAAEFIAEVCA